MPQLNTKQPQRHRQQSQSHQQSITVNKLGRSTQLGGNSNRGRPRVQNERDQGRVFPYDLGGCQSSIRCGGRYAANE